MLISSLQAPRAKVIDIYLELLATDLLKIMGGRSSHGYVEANWVEMLHISGNVDVIGLRLSSL